MAHESAIPPTKLQEYRPPALNWYSTSSLWERILVPDRDAFEAGHVIIIY
jgi:hypothetical protein